MGVGSDDILRAGQIHLVREVLDSQLYDRRGVPMGRVDGLVVALRDGAPPKLLRIESGLDVAAARLSPRLGRWVRALGRRWGKRGGEPVRIPWEKVIRIGPEVDLDVGAEETAALAWEQWLYDRVLSRIPFSGRPTGSRNSSPGDVATRHTAAACGPEPIARHEVRLELLLSRPVIDLEGKPAGRIEEVVAGLHDGQWAVREYLLGRHGLVERLSVVDFARAFVRLLGATKGTPSHRVPWDQLDLSDPRRPALRSPAEEVAPVSARHGGAG